MDATTGQPDAHRRPLVGAVDLGVGLRRRPAHRGHRRGLADADDHSASPMAWPLPVRRPVPGLRQGQRRSSSARRRCRRGTGAKTVHVAEADKASATGLDGHRRSQPTGPLGLPSSTLICDCDFTARRPATSRSRSAMQVYISGYAGPFTIAALTADDDDAAGRGADADAHRPPRRAGAAHGLRLTTRLSTAARGSAATRSRSATRCGHAVRRGARRPELAAGRLRRHVAGRRLVQRPPVRRARLRVRREAVRPVLQGARRATTRTTSGSSRSPTRTTTPATTSSTRSALFAAIVCDATCANLPTVGFTAYGGARQRHDQRQPDRRPPRGRLGRRHDPRRARRRPHLRRLRRQRQRPHARA